jgi:hypothetical protein
MFTAEVVPGVFDESALESQDSYPALLDALDAAIALQTVSSGDGIRAETYVDADGSFMCHWEKVGRVVTVRVLVRLNASATTTWGGVYVAKNLPAATDTQYGVLRVDGSGTIALCSVNNTGNLHVVTREASLAGKALYGHITYISTE